MNYILVDFENVQPKSLEQLTAKHFKVILFVGASQTRLPRELEMSAQRLGSRLRQIKISGHGSNALDFHIAYFLGRHASEPSACFHIISKDTGYDPLIQHLKSQKISAGRFKTITDIPMVKVSKSKLPQERLILTRLQKLKAAKPKTVKKLSNMIVSWFHLSEQDVALLVQSLAKQGYLKFAGAKVTYALPIT